VCGVVEDYRRNLTELEANFSTEEVCRAYLGWLRWPWGRFSRIRGPITRVVSGHVVGDKSEKRRQRAGPAELRDSVDLAHKLRRAMVLQDALC
jgi:hypothetical protein